MEEKRKRWFLFLILVVSILCVAPQIVRLLSIIRYYGVFVTTGAEGINFYNIWRVINRHPLYTNPWLPPFNVTLYNFGFYWSYGLLARVIGVNDAGIMLFSRFMSLAFAVGGACLSVATVQLIYGKLTSAAKMMAAMLAIVMWLGLNSTVWWAMSARPDMESCAFAMLGCYLYARHLSGKGTYNCILAGLSFAAAWTCKQSTIWSAGACFIFALLIRKKLRESACLAIPGVAVLLVALAFARSTYWQNVLGGPSVDYVVLRLAVMRTLEVVLPNVAIFIIPAVVLVDERLRRRLYVPPESELNVPVVQLMFLVAAITLIMGIMSIGRTGTSRNQLFEAMFAFAVLCTVCCIECFLRPDRWASTSMTRTRVITVFAFLVMLILPAFTLAKPRLDAGPLHWHLTWINSSSYTERVRLANEVRRLPRPLLIKDEVLSLPWNSSGDAYPAEASDWPTYELAKKAGRLSANLESEIAARHFAAIVLTPDDPLLAVTRLSGYSVQSTYDETFGALGEKETLLVLLRQTGQ